MVNKPICESTRQELIDELERLRSRETLFEETEKIASIGHFEWDHEFNRLKSCSREYARIYNMSIAEVMESQDSWEKTILQIHPEDRSAFQETTRLLHESGALSIDFRIIRNDGEIRHLREFDKVVLDANGEKCGVFGLLQDITEQVEYEQELKYRDRLFQQAESIVDIGHYIYDEYNRKHLYVSPGFTRIHGIEAEEYLATRRSLDELIMDIHEDDRVRVMNEYKDFAITGEECAIEYRIRQANGKIRWIRELNTRHVCSDGKMIQSLGVMQDITERVGYERELQYKEALAREAETITEIGHFIFDDLKEKYLYVSPGLAKIFGIDAAEIIRSIGSIEDDLGSVFEADRERVRRVYQEYAKNGGDWLVEYQLTTKDKLRWIRESGRAHKIVAGTVRQSIGVLQDITAQKNAATQIIRAKEKLETQVAQRTRELADTVKQLEEEIVERNKISAELDFLANHDALTGLPSLRLCKDRLDRSLADSRRNRQTSAVMFLDLDGFKMINDSHGHEVGDNVLKVTADRIKAEIRETDTVARIGGDEFIIILSRVPDMDILQRVASSLIQQISEAIHIEQKTLRVGASIGIATYPEDGTTSEELIKAADKAMYLVKHSGKNNFGFTRSTILN